MNIMSIGENVKKIREAKDMTQQELADRVHTSVPTICRLEVGTKIPSVPLLVAIAKALGVSAGVFFEEREA